MAELKCKLLHIGEYERISDKFAKREFIVETIGNYPKNVCLQLVNDRTDLIGPYDPGEEITVSFDPESVQKSGRWFTNLKVWKIQRIEKVDQEKEINQENTPF